MKKGLLASAALAAAVAGSGVANAYTVVSVTNPGFESPTVTGQSTTAPTGWTPFNNAGTADNTIFTPPQGSQVGWADVGGLYQDLGVITPGEQYTLSLDVVAPKTADLTYAPGGYNFGLAYQYSPGLGNASFFAGSSNEPFIPANTYQSFTISGIAPVVGGSPHLVVYLFETTNGYPVDNLAGFDNVSVLAGVPEASTWAMMGLGFAGLFGVRKRRQARPVAA